MSGIYIHIPFCHSKCAYCDFYSMPARDYFSAYIDAVIREWSFRKDEVAEPIKTVYIGGGTPSILPMEELDRLLKEFADKSIDEFTIEVNPEDVSEELANYLSHNSPVNRVSMGIQSLVDTELSVIGRRHSASKALMAVDTLRVAGIENISCDLIYGLPSQTIETWKYSLNKILTLKLPHLSCYLLSYEEGTRLHAMLTTGKVHEATESEAEAYYSYLCEAAALVGYEHYEISNFALPDKQSKHNSSYWDSTPYIGLGTAAHSFDGKIRRYNPSNIKKYLDSYKSATDSPFYLTEDETESQRFNDYIITSLRTSKGIWVEECAKRFGVERSKKLLNKAMQYVNTEAMTLENDHLRISEGHWLISDRIMINFIEV